MAATSSFVKFLEIIGVNHVTAEVVGAKLLGISGLLQSENLGGYLNPDVINGYSYNPSDGQWYQPSIFTGKFDFTSPASAEQKAELEQERYWRQLSNRVENVGPANGEAGDQYSPSIIELIGKLPEIINRYREIAPETWIEFSNYFGWPNFVGINDITYDINGNVNGLTTSALNWVPPRRDPLILGGGGIKTSGINPNAPILFDQDGDGTLTATGWVAAGEGIVVRDLNGNGLIDSGRELFGFAELGVQSIKVSGSASNLNLGGGNTQAFI